MEKNKITVDPTKIPKEKANKKRHDDERVLRETTLEILRYNLFLLRETYRMLYRGSKIKFNTFYKALDITDKMFDNFLRNLHLSSSLYDNISKALTPTSMSKKYYRNYRPILYRTPIEVEECLNKYFYASERAEKEKCRIALDKAILKTLNSGDSQMTYLMFVCNDLSNSVLFSSQTALWKTSETLQKLMQIDFSESDMDTEAFADFITNLAKTINSIEEDFPEFYAVAQHIKEEKTAQSIMNEITNKLNELSNMDISSSDAQSASCLNMMNGIADVMKSVQKSLSE